MDVLEISEIASVSVILAAIFLWNLITVWQIRSQSDRLVQEVRAQIPRMSDVERGQAHLEGCKSTQSDVFGQHSRTHETRD